MTDKGWEARMAERARTRAVGGRYGLFSRWLRPGDPEDILPEILAARCLGIRYGDPGPLLDPGMCRACWGDRHVWLGNTWGLQHREPGFGDCRHACHEGEIWRASA